MKTGIPRHTRFQHKRAAKALKLTALSILSITLLLTSKNASAFNHDEIPGAPQKTPIALQGGTIHTVSGETIENGTILFEDGKITAIGSDLKLPKRTEKINLAGKHVFPGLFEAHSSLGLVEISSTDTTVDNNELGSFNPNVQAQVAVNPDSELIPVTRSNGVLLALSVPVSGTIAGQSAVLQLDGWTFEDLTLKSQAAMHLSWPRMTPRVSWRRPDSADAQLEARDRQLREIREYFDLAQNYRQAREAAPEKYPIDLKLEAMIPVLKGEMPVMIRADEALAIQSAVAFSVEYGLKPIIFGGMDAPLCSELLLEHQVPVIVSAVYRRPARSDDAYDSAYTLPARLKEAGIQFCISGADRSETWNARNLPYNAGTAVAFGLEMEEAIKAVTLYPAQILGVDEHVGSLEIGKDATLFICDGNPLETSTQVVGAFVQGRKVQLTDKQKRLYEKYSEKYNQQAESK